MKYIERVNNAVRGGGEGLVEALEGLGFKISSREEIRCFQELINIQSNKSQVSKKFQETNKLEKTNKFQVTNK